MEAAAAHPPLTAVPNTVSASQMGHANTSTRSSMRRRVHSATAASASTVGAGSPMPHFIGAAPQAYSSPTFYRDPTALRGNDRAGTASPFRVLSSSQQQAELRANRSDSRTMPPPPPPPPPNLAHEHDSRQERSFIFQLRGLPFAATRKDVESFLRTVDYDQLDVGTLATGESSGNAFVELHGLRAAEKLGRLHNTVITVAADASVPARERPRPRYIEVLDADAARREQVLRIDALTARSALPLPRRFRAAAAAAANTSSVSGTSTDASQQQQQHPVRQAQHQAFVQPPPQMSAEGGVRYFTTSPMTPLSVSSTLITPVSSQRFLDVSRYVCSPSATWNAYAQQQHSAPPLPSSTMSMPHLVASQPAPVGSSGAPPMVRIQNVEGSGVMRSATSAPSAFYQFATPIAPQTQDPQQQRVPSTPNVSYFVVAAVPSPATLSEARSTYYVAPLSSTQAATAGSYYYLGSGSP
ncbi:hypothetical protein LDHU3_33.4010:CDS1 [Leishmania donovani]|uniref:Hypothetical_protein n=1 Tax=Leishmania donovani TaxID=5661 RepID=A0A6J8FQQ4_LEIDO|nr:hypothetical protein LDHU3_33.4010:CDS1 [Leishmania donovani]VDZ48109.1 hypothetical_protein [Leishmania donovani]